MSRVCYQLLSASPPLSVAPPVGVCALWPRRCSLPSVTWWHVAITAYNTQLNLYAINVCPIWHCPNYLENDIKLVVMSLPTWILSSLVSPQTVASSWWLGVWPCRSLWFPRCCRWTPVCHSTRPGLCTRWCWSGCVWPLPSLWVGQMETVVRNLVCLLHFHLHSRHCYLCFRNRIFMNSTKSNYKKTFFTWL